MAEQKITVTLDPRQVADLKQFVREELRKEREATQRPVAPRPSADPMPEELYRIRLELAGFALWCEQRMDSEVIRTDIAPRLRNIQRGEPWRDRDEFDGQRVYRDGDEA